MKKRWALKIAAVLGAALLVCSCSGSGSVPSGSPASDPVSSERIPDIVTSSQYSAQNIWGSGWNLGNTLDAKSDGSKENLGLKTETSWGMPMTSQEMIKAVAAKGFKTIRIPISWHNHITEESGHKIDPEWLARVKTIVDWSLAAGMKVIINIHHDNLGETYMVKPTGEKVYGMDSTYGFCVPENNESLKNESKTYIVDVWKQVAEYFKAYDDSLVFELLNEPRAVGKEYEWSTTAGMEDKVLAANAIIKEYEQAALDEIRKTGGNNATRYVMVPPYAASPSMMNGWSLPTDSASGKLIVSVHAYAPYEFCMGNDTTFTAAHKSNIENWLFKTLDQEFVSKGIPVIIGETSASDKNNYDERVKWTKCFFGASKERGISSMLWDNMVVYPTGTDKAERHGYFNRNACSWF